jgi:NADPH:quinone reductase-like Zn-dependent oxidoreductase
MVELPEPQPGPKDVLIEVHAININPVDIKTRKGGAMYGSLKQEGNVILGGDISGIVKATGAETTRFKVGDEVFGMVNFPGHGKAYAEYAVAPEDHLVLKPNNCTHV